MYNPMPTASAKAELIADLRSKIADIESPTHCLSSENRDSDTIGLGIEKIDAFLPDGGLARGALHEVRARDYGHMGAGISFGVALAVRCARRFADAPILWCESLYAPFDIGQLYGPGLAAFGLDPARLIIVNPASPVDLLWTMEEGLRLGAFAAVIGEIDGRSSALTLTATRRLQLAAEDSNRPALLLTGHVSMGASSAATRWVISAAPSRLQHGDGSLIGRTCWNARLEKCRGNRNAAMAGMPADDWRIEWNAQQQIFCDASSADGQAHIPPSVAMPAFAQAV